jgi:uncharacterized lipoprotein
MKKTILLAVFALVVAGCSENGNVSQLRLEKNKLAHDLKIQSAEHSEKIEQLNIEHEQALESLKTDYEAKLAEKDELLEHFRQQAEIDKVSLDSYAKMLIKIMPAQEKLEEENAALKARVEELENKFQTPPLSEEETKAKLEAMALIRQKAIDESN